MQLLRRGTDALHRGEIPRATQLLKRAHQLRPENPDAALNLGGAYILAKRFARAVEILKPLSTREPENPMVWVNLGAAYLGNPVLARDREHEQAIGAFKMAYKLDPATPHVAYNLGLIYRDRDEREAALRWFRRALQADPLDRDARSHIEKIKRDTTDHGSRTSEAED
jgi:Flp pilus assembly protein TadD